RPGSRMGCRGRPRNLSLRAVNPLIFSRARRVALGLFVLAAPAVPPATAQLTVDAPAVDAASLLDHVQFLARRELAGRATGSPGADVARQYVVNLFDEVGLEPAGHEGW